MIRKSIILYASLIMLMACSQDKGRIFLIPEGYKGIVIIFYDVQDGAPKEFDKGKEVFRIPENGVLRTQFSLDTSWVNSDDINYYYYSGSSRTQIARVDFPKDLPNDTVQIMGEEVGSGYSFSNNYFIFFVCANKDADSLSLVHQKLDLRKLIEK